MVENAIKMRYTECINQKVYACDRKFNIIKPPKLT